MVYAHSADYSGALTAEEFDFWAAQASHEIDRMTLGRAEHTPAAHADLRDACVQMAELMAAQHKAAVNSACGAVSSASTDGYSESYTTAVSCRGRLVGILASCLGDDRYGLLYRGVL